MHRMSARAAALIFLALTGGALFKSARAQETGRTLTGEFRVHRNFHSRYLKSDRDVLVYLPPAYEVDRRRRYPVLYLHDGQNLFDGATSFIRGAEWQVDETAQRLIGAGEVEPLIVVGVYNAGDRRIDEYTPARDDKHARGGEADRYGRLLVEDLKPFIEAYDPKTWRSPADAMATRFYTWEASA